MPSTSHRIGITLLLACAACGSGGSAAPPRAASPGGTTSSESSDDDATAGVLEHHRYHHHGGATLFIALSLDTLGVSPEERGVIEKIQRDLHARMEPARLEEQSLIGALADGLATGTFDAAKIDAAVARVGSAAATVHEASADALNQLHAALNEGQRAALVDKVSSHWAVWQRANVGGSAPAGADAAHVAVLAADLDLSASQVDKIRAALGDASNASPRLDPDEMTAHLRAFGDAFRRATFDAHALTTAGRADERLVGWGAAHMARFIETAGPFLTPEQRTQLAQRLRAHQSHDPSAQEARAGDGVPPRAHAEDAK